MEMVAYREAAMRHGNRWLVRKRLGVTQELRKGKGDAAELEAKLAILLGVMGERRALAMRSEERIGAISAAKDELAGKKNAIDGQIRRMTAPLQKKKALAEKQMAGLASEMEAEKSAEGMLEEIGKNGLGTEKRVREFWERQMG